MLFLQKRPASAEETIEMAIADWCGHDSRGNPTLRTTADGTELLGDVPKVAAHMRAKGIWA